MLCSLTYGVERVVLFEVILVNLKRSSGWKTELKSPIGRRHHLTFLRVLGLRGLEKA